MTTHEGMAALATAEGRWNAGDITGYLSLYHDDAVVHGYPGVEPGIASIRAFYQGFFTAFPGARLTIEDAFPSGDKVTCRFVVSGSHEGPFHGLPPTHKPFRLPGITVLRFRDGRCIERWSQADFLSLMQQLGAFPG